MLDKMTRARIAMINSLDAVGGLQADLRAGLIMRADWARCGGPWLVTHDDQAIFDGVNAGWGLGYNSGPLFGAVQYAGVWAEDWEDTEIQAVRKSMQSFVVRKPHWQHLAAVFSSPRELVRRYISTQVLEQFTDRRVALTGEFREVLTSVAARWLGADAGRFLAATDVQDRRLVCQLAVDENPQALLLQHGVLASLLPGNQVAIEIPLASTRSDLGLLAERVVNAWRAGSPQPATVVIRSYEHYYRYHSHLIDLKRRAALGQGLTVAQTLESLQAFMPPDLQGMAQLQLLTQDNWPKFRLATDRLQKMIYEPARQTSLSTFDPLFQDPYGYGLLVLVDGEIVGMASAGPLILFPNERGTNQDSQRENRHILYPVDLTVTERYRGALGTYLKRGMAMIGLAAGHHAFHGRNRDRLAAAMWAINLSLGSYQIRHLPDDYPDTLPHRDCIYYRCPLTWTNSRVAIESTQGIDMQQAIAGLIYC
jgi:hypothetical protein